MFMMDWSNYLPTYQMNSCLKLHAPIHYIGRLNHHEACLSTMSIDLSYSNQTFFSKHARISYSPWTGPLSKFRNTLGSHLGVPYFSNAPIMRLYLPHNGSLLPIFTHSVGAFNLGTYWHSIISLAPQVWGLSWSSIIAKTWRTSLSGNSIQVVV